VSIDYDKEIDFNLYKTYSWLPPSPPLPKTLQQRIEDAIDWEFDSKDFIKVSDSSDLSIEIHARVDQTQTVETRDFDMDYHWHYFGAATVKIEDIEVGSVMVDITDTKTKKLVWRGMAKGVMTQDADKNREILRKAMHKLFLDFPPKREKE
jgi:hypothetical protein